MQDRVTARAIEVMTRCDTTPTLWRGPGDVGNTADLPGREVT